MRSLALFILAVAAAALVGASFSPGPWYEALQKPPWTPPNWLFGPVWTLLYLAIAVAGWSVYRSGSSLRSPALLLWLAQLLLNAAWSWLFFGLHRPDIAFLDIVLLECAIVAFIVFSRKISRLAAALFVLYALWVGYAAALNLSIWQANPLSGAG